MLYCKKLGDDRPALAGRPSTSFNLGGSILEKKRFYLKWPWNLVVYILLVLVLRVFAIPVILLLMSWNKKQQPDGPEEGYCLQRTRYRLANLGWAALFLVIGGGLAALFLYQAPADKSGWELADYGTFAVAGIGGFGFLAAAVYEGWTSLRDALFPEKSRLARSIRSQLPYPDEAPPVQELFAMVDRDIRENGQQFDRTYVGKEWLLGDDASLLSRIRVVFDRDETTIRHRGGRTQSSRIIQLYILDDRKQVQATGLRNPSELQPLLTCLKLRCPEALFRPYSEYLDYCGKSEEEWQALMREYNVRKAQRELREEEQARDAARGSEFVPPVPQEPRVSRADTRAVLQRAGILGSDEPGGESPMTLTLSERGGATREYRSFTGRDIELAAEGLAEGKYVVVYLRDRADYIYLQAGTAEDGRVTVNVSRPSVDRLRVYETKCTDRQAKKFLLDWAAGRFSEDLSQWKDITKKLEKQTKK